MTEVDAFLANCRLADGRLIDIGISGGQIAVVGEGAAASSNSAPALNIGGDLVLPPSRAACRGRNARRRRP